MLAALLRAFDAAPKHNPRLLGLAEEGAADASDIVKQVVPSLMTGSTAT
jgi:hypothetical protein